LPPPLHPSNTDNSAVPSFVHTTGPYRVLREFAGRVQVLAHEELIAFGGTS